MKDFISDLLKEFSGVLSKKSKVIILSLILFISLIVSFWFYVKSMTGLPPANIMIPVYLLLIIISLIITIIIMDYKKMYPSSRWVFVISNGKEYPMPFIEVKKYNKKITPKLKFRELTTDESNMYPRYK